jgi:hypothetical protein
MKRISAAIAIPLLTIICSFPIDGQSTTQFFLHERFVIRSVRQIHSAQATYQATQGAGNFGSLVQLENAGFIDAVLGSGSKYGYSFVITVAPYTQTSPASFRLTATPNRYPRSGRRSFFIDTSGEMRAIDNGGVPATENDPYIDDCVLYGLSDNERCTLGDMRTLHGSETTYQATSGNGNFGTLAQLAGANLIRQRLANGSTRGYSYTVTLVNFVPGQSSATFKISAVPITYGVTGIKSFFIATDGVLRGADKNGGEADENDPPIDH